jgi:hypothetical protein
MESVNPWDLVQVWWKPPGLSDAREARYIFFVCGDKKAQAVFAEFVEALAVPNSFLLLQTFQSSREIRGDAKRRVFRDLQIKYEETEKNLRIKGWDYYSFSSEIMDRLRLEEREAILFNLKRARDQIMRAQEPIDKEEWIKLNGLIEAGLKKLVADQIWHEERKIDQKLLDEVLDNPACLSVLSVQRRLCVFHFFRRTIKEIVEKKIEVNPEFLKKVREILLIVHELWSVDFPKRTKAMVESIRLLEESCVKGRVFVSADLEHLMEGEKDRDPRCCLSSLYEVLNRLPAVIVSAKDPAF